MSRDSTVFQAQAVIPAFTLSGLPKVVYGDGAIQQVPALVSAFGRRVLLVLGNRSFRDSGHWPPFSSALRHGGIEWTELRIAGEPSPGLVDEAVRAHRNTGIEVVLGIGGGSVLDAAKAIAGLLLHENSVMDYLEGVGPELPYLGPSTPFIAVPTTAGTGSEATKNAVLSVAGDKGFKKSFRHDLLVPRYAVIDPALLASCPPELIAANGMDALTQLLESYVSTRANPFTDALALSGLESVRCGLLEWYESGPASSAARGHMAFAAMLSGITLAQAGLGSVHGLAAPLGAYFPIPHGVACGTLVAEATRVNIHVLGKSSPNALALKKYARAGRLLSGRTDGNDDVAQLALVRLLENWTAKMRLPGLSAYGVEPGDLPRIVANCRGSSMRTNPVLLTDDDLRNILLSRI